jgi:hypothetical protein
MRVSVYLRKCPFFLTLHLINYKVPSLFSKIVLCRVDYLATHSYSGCVDCDVGYLWDLYNRYSRIFSRKDL